MQCNMNDYNWKCNENWCCWFEKIDFSIRQKSQIRIIKDFFYRLCSINLIVLTTIATQTKSNFDILIRLFDLIIDFKLKNNEQFTFDF